MLNIEQLKSLGSQKTEYRTDQVRPELLESFDTNESIRGHKRNTLVCFIQDRDEFTSLCPKTGQPDHARMEIIYIPNKKMVESKSLKLYLFSFRNTGEFHEDVCNRIANDLFTLLEPFYLRVYGNFVPRGGLAIRPLVERWHRLVDPLHKQEVRLFVNSWELKK